MDTAVPPSELLRFGYVLVFGSAALVCFGSLRRTVRIEDEDTQRGLAALLAVSGVWAASHVGYLVAPTPWLQYGFFLVGLIVGFAAVGPWLYFCSAYTGRKLHRSTAIRQSAVAVYLLVVSVKLTNPLHGQYFSVEPVATPFSHLAIHHEPLHWVAMGLAYSLSFVGFFMLFELFARVSYDTKPLAGIVALTGVPVILDISSAMTPHVLDLTYSSLGVAVFAVGVTHVYVERFQFVRLTGETDNPLVVLGADDEIRDHNRAAEALFSRLADARGQQLATVLPSVAAALEDTESVIDVDDDGEQRYYQVSSTPFTADHGRLGRIVTLTDITHRETYRRQLQQQNARLEEFASLVSHDLRNPLSVAKGRVDLAMEEDDPESLPAAAEALDRMEELIEDLLTLARTGAGIDETEPVALAEVTQDSWQMVESEAATLTVATSLPSTVEADPERLQQLFENLFRNAIEHGGDDVTVTVGGLDTDAGFYVEDDGAGLPEDRSDLFEAGVTTTPDGTGFGLSIVAEIASAHGWQVRATDAADGGARFEIRTT